MSFLKNLFIALGFVSTAFFSTLSAGEIIPKSIIEADDSNFSEVLNSGPCIANFYSVNDKNSRLFTRVFKVVASQYRKLVKFIAVNTDLSYYTNEAYNVSSVPTVIFFLEGVEIYRVNYTTHEGMNTNDFVTLMKKVYRD